MTDMEARECQMERQKKEHNHIEVDEDETG
jgi:hypothetical protein